LSKIEKAAFMTFFDEISTKMKKLLFSLTLLSSSLYSQWTLVGPRGFSNFFAANMHMTVDKVGTPYIVFRGWQSGTTVMKCDGIWDTVGNRNFSQGIASLPKIRFDYSNTPFVAYSDVDRSARISVKKYGATIWDSIGNIAFTDGPSSSSDLAFNPITNEPYIVYRDRNRQFRCTVMRFNGTSWEFVGTPGFSDIGNGWEGALNNKIAFDSQGTPYVAFTDCSIGWKASVAKFDGAQWIFLGGMGCTPGSAGNPSLLVDHNDVPYIAFSDQTQASRGSVMKWDGNAWAYVGNPGFSVGSAGEMSLACDAKNNLFVAYRDYALYDYAVVKRLQAGTWNNLGDSVISEAEAHYINLAIDNQGTAYLAYADGGVNYYATMKRFLHAGQAVGIEENKKENIKFSIQPNPASGVVQCLFPAGLKGSFSISVQNTLGEILYQEKLSDHCLEHTLDLSQFPKGLYFICLSGKNIKQVEKVVLD
jgi:hypothetical protein